MSDLDELLARIQAGEDLHTEFKERLTDREDMAKSLVCFANSDGGIILIGIADNGSVLGVEDAAAISRGVDDIGMARCEPPLAVVAESVRVEGKAIVLVRVPKGSQKPYRTASGRYYLRTAGRCRQASWEEVRRLYQTSQSVFFDESPVARATVDDIDLSRFRRFLESRYGVSEETEVEPFLRNLHVIQGHAPTLAGMLFFGGNPQSFIPFARISAARIPGKDLAASPVDAKDIGGSMTELLDDAFRFIRLALPQPHHIEAMKPEIEPGIPEVAIREALVNAVAHRDYTISAPVRLFVFDDRLEVRTPGQLPNSVTLESMRAGGSHVLRNPTLYNLLARAGMVTDIGSGVYRLIKLVRDRIGKEVMLEAGESEFLLVIPRP